MLVGERRSTESHRASDEVGIPYTMEGGVGDRSLCRKSEM